MTPFHELPEREQAQIIESSTDDANREQHFMLTYRGLNVYEMTREQLITALIRIGTGAHEALPNQDRLGGQEEPLPSITQKEAGE